MDIVEKLNLTLNNPSYNREQMLRKVCVCASQLIPSANLISLWRFDSDKHSIISLINYDVDNKSWSQGTELKQLDFPEYFESLLEKDLIVASDARNFSATRCFNRSYFEPNDIHSLLDFILHRDFAPTGIICCESKGKPVEWSKQDVENIRKIATMISFFFDV